MSLSIAEKLSRAAVRNCELYVPETRDESRHEIYLNANENPYTAPIKLELAMNRYPESQPAKVIERYARYLGVDSDEILVTLGGDLAIELLIKAFCEGKKDQLLYCPPTFGMYQVTCDLFEVKTVQVPLLEDFKLDVEGIIQNLEGVKMVFLCSPNNPTGNTLETADVERILEATKDRAIVVLDEAYIEFSERDSFAKRVKEFPHLALVRTLSKAFGLAGIRLGFAIGSAPLINVLKRAISPYPLAVPTIAVAEAALTDENIAVMWENCEKLIQGREALTAALKSLPFVKKVYPSEANFILIDLDDAKGAYEYLKSKGIYVRAQGSERLQNSLRISVGLPEENNAFIDALIKFHQ